MRWALPGVAAVAVFAVACAAPSLIPDDQGPAVSPRAPDSFHVAVTTTKGEFTVAAHRAWSPLAVDRFHDLVERGYYQDIVIYRVVEGFVAQLGLHGDPFVANAWKDRGIPDEPVLASNRRGRISFARSGPESRTTQLFINLEDNTPRLDTLEVAGIEGYPAFGEVREGMEVVDAFESRYGEDPSAFQDSIRLLGNDFLDRVFPGLDRILEAEVVRTWR